MKITSKFMQYSLLIVILPAAANLFGQTSCAGFVGELPFKVLTNIYFDEATRVINAAETGEGVKYENKEIMQSASLPGKYFKTVLSKTKDDYYARVVAVEIFEKKTDRLLQKIKLNCEDRGAKSVSTGDYNFDGIQDFSVFEESYAGANTSSLYFLYNPRTKIFLNSGFEGTSLSFDEKKKRIFETNQCCAGRSETRAIYKVVRNKMVSLEEHCYVWDDKKKDQVERKMKECQ